MSRRTVFLTGATGVWGRATLAEFARRGTEYHVIALVQSLSDVDKVIVDYQDQGWLTLLEGDLIDPSVVAYGVKKANVVLHLGAVVSPLADQHPQWAMRVNITGVHNLVRAVRSLPDPGSVALVGVGSVAQYGSRNPPLHWGE